MMIVVNSGAWVFVHSILNICFLFFSVETAASFHKPERGQRTTGRYSLQHTEHEREINKSHEKLL